MNGPDPGRKKAPMTEIPVPSKSSGSLPRGLGLVSLVVFLVIVVAGGGAIGAFTAPGAWFAALVKPSFNPPNWLFGPVWTLLYLAIASAGWRCWQRQRDGIAMKIWIAQLAVNFSWSPIFFSAQRIDLALGVIVILLALILAFIAATRRQDRVSALLFVPYAAWVAFATVLNASILYLN